MFSVPLCLGGEKILILIREHPCKSVAKSL
jgi:hypothetical protein